nr:MAG TPA: hypothetical protein [Caudoviricetes sp.]
MNENERKEKNSNKSLFKNKYCFKKKKIIAENVG